MDVIDRPQLVQALTNGQGRWPLLRVPDLAGPCGPASHEAALAGDDAAVLEHEVADRVGDDRLGRGARCYEALAADPDRSLPELAADLGVSAHHLSRIFRAAAGHTLSRHRMRLRVRAALERLAGGERSLARLAADLGFADQGHLCRVIRGETGHTPSALRRALA